MSPKCTSRTPKPHEQANQQCPEKQKPTHRVEQNNDDREDRQAVDLVAFSATDKQSANLAAITSQFAKESPESHRVFVAYSLGQRPELALL
jgi:hypothetical protein